MLLEDGPRRSAHRLLLAHGAGAPMDSPFLNQVASDLGERGVWVVRFEFPYMQERRRLGSRRPPSRQPALLDYFLEVMEDLPGPLSQWCIGGKSMGGRMASYLADDAGVRGLVCLGYPFHPPGKPEKLRTAHLADLVTPTLILQGERDRLGTREEVAKYALSPAIQTHFLADGDHSFVPRKRSGVTFDENLSQATEVLHEWMRALAAD